jgi:sugar/nucleoside kinase (ribokinase family)
VSATKKYGFVTDWQLPDTVPDNEVQWPRVRRREDGDGPKAFILGPVVEDWMIDIDAKRAEFTGALSQGFEKLRRDWRAAEPVVGGSLAFHAKAAQSVGYVIYLSCIIPVPCPATFSRLFEEVNADTRFARAMPGVVPGALCFNFRDGHLLVPRPGVQALATPVVPPSVFDDFDVVIVNPGPPMARIDVLQALHNAKKENSRTPLAVALRSDWGQNDLAALAHCPATWAFANELEAIDIAKRLTNGEQEIANVEAAIERVKQELGSTRLLITLGPRGGYLYNGKLVKFSTHPLENGSAIGAGDLAMVTTVVSSAAGASDESSAQRGINAGTRHVAGLPLVDRLELLD